MHVLSHYTHVRTAATYSFFNIFSIQMNENIFLINFNFFDAEILK